MFDPDIVVQMQNLFDTGVLRKIMQAREEAALALLHPNKTG